jgi:hypothetical protein
LLASGSFIFKGPSETRGVVRACHAFRTIAMRDDDPLGIPGDHPAHRSPQVTPIAQKCEPHIERCLAVRIGRPGKLDQPTIPSAPDALRLEVLDEVGENQRA